MNRRPLLAVCLYCMTFAAAVSASPVLDQEHFDPADTFSALSVANDRTQVQTFTVGVSGLLSRIDVKVGRREHTTEDLQFTLFSTGPSGLPQDAMATVHVPASAADPDLLRKFVSFDVQSFSLDVAAGDLLAIALNTNAPNVPPRYTERYEWEIGGRYGKGAAYSKIGPLYFRKDEDFYFRSFVSVPEPSTVCLIAVFLVYRQMVRSLKTGERAHSAA